MPEPILTLYNPHAAACGTPLAFTNEAAEVYIGYFANRYGEQWVFTFDRPVTRSSPEASAFTSQGANVRPDGSGGWTRR